MLFTPQRSSNSHFTLYGLTPVDKHGAALRAGNELDAKSIFRKKKPPDEIRQAVYMVCNAMIVCQFIFRLEL